MSANFVHEVSGPVQVHGFVAPGRRSLASLETGPRGRAFSPGTGADPEPDIADHSIVEFPAGGRELICEAMAFSVDALSAASRGEARREPETKPFELAAPDLAVGAESGLDLPTDWRLLDHFTRGRDLPCDARIKTCLDEPETSVDALLARALDGLAPQPLRATRETP